VEAAVFVDGVAVVNVGAEREGNEHHEEHDAVVNHSCEHIEHRILVHLELFLHFGEQVENSYADKQEDNACQASCVVIRFDPVHDHVVQLTVLELVHSVFRVDQRFAGEVHRVFLVVHPPLGEKTVAQDHHEDDDDVVEYLEIREIELLELSTQRCFFLCNLLFILLIPNQDTLRKAEANVLNLCSGSFLEVVMRHLLHRLRILFLRGFLRLEVTVDKHHDQVDLSQN